MHALADYTHGGHPYQMAVWQANAIPWIEHRQCLLAVRLDNSSEFWRIRDELARGRGDSAS